MNATVEQAPASIATPAANQDKPKTIAVNPFELPVSSLLSAESGQAILQTEHHYISWAEKTASLPLSEDTPIEEAAAIRQAQAELFYEFPLYKKMRARYPVVIETEIIAGVNTEIFTPTDGVAPEHESQVLINLHGGSFTYGARSFSHLESIPIAAVGKTKVISVDYRMLPEHHFPAARDDAIAVYQQLLAEGYQAKNIGIYGSSAGAFTTAQIIAHLQQLKLPMPGAIGMSCGAGLNWNLGDSGHFAQGITGYPVPGAETHRYFTGVDVTSPEVFPGKTPEILAQFPPSLLMVSTRDFTLSSVVHMHAQLVKQGVETDLHVWDGLDHYFLINAELPESREAYSVMANFFAEHLGVDD